MCVHTRENPLTGSVSDTIGRSPRSFIPPVSRSVSFSLSSTGLHCLLLPSRADIRSASIRTRQLASAIRNLRGSMAGRENYFEPHETTHTTVTKPNGDRKGNGWPGIEETGVTRDSPRVRFSSRVLSNPFVSLLT